MKYHAFLVVLLITFVAAFAETKTLTVLGDKQIKLSFDGDMPKAMKAGGIKTDVTGFIFGDGRLIPSFGFEAKTKKKIIKVQVEEVSGASPKMMVEDLAPVISEQRWKGDSKPSPITKEANPWAFERGPTMFIYRFTVELEGESKPVVIYQAAVFGDQFKEYLSLIAKAKKG